MSHSNYILQLYTSVNALAKLPTRPLTATEIKVLIANNCHLLPSTSWSAIHVFQSSSSSTTFSIGNTIRNVTFGGTCTLGNFTNTFTHVDGVTLPGGLYDTTIVDSVICDGARVSQTVLLSRCVVGSGAAVVGCGKVCMKSSNSSFANGRAIGIAIETGGREVMMCAGMTLEIAARVSGDRSDTETIHAWEERASFVTQSVTCNKSLLSARSILLNCPRIEDVFIGSGAFLENSTLVNSSVLSSDDAEKDPHAQTKIVGGCFVENSIIQWGCECESMAIVSGSFMCATSHVEKHAKLLDSILGPCSGASEGEITASLVGPFVGFHHQSLLIACYWPSGRGNIGYGANVGSNHTGKAPDQEIWPGEGVFFGLATAIKFPSNFTRAPYTLIATGATTLPQRLEMPFSLINTAGETMEGISPALNEVMPGWILSDNLYMVLRGETKFLKRGEKARRMSTRTGRVDYDNEALRPTTVKMMLDARARLACVDVTIACKYKDRQGGGIWTDKEIPGLGKNYMKESARQKAIQTYSDFILFYGVRAMWRALQHYEIENKDRKRKKKKNANSLTTFNEEILHGEEYAVSSQGMLLAKTTSTDSSGDTNARYGKRLGELEITSTLTRDERGAHFLEEWYGYAMGVTRSEMERQGILWSVKDALLKYVELQSKFAASVLVSKQKDDKRGPKIIDGYMKAHGVAEKDDAVVAKAKNDAENERVAVLEYLERNVSTPPSKL